MLPDFFKFSLPTKVIYGNGLVSKLGDEVGSFGKRKALILTDQVLVKTGLTKKLEEGLKGSNIEIGAIFDKIPPNSELECVEKATEIGIEKGCDCIIALGGGSVMDTAKVTNILMVKGGKLSDHMGAHLIEGRPLLPAIFIPTTSGTGSEVTQFAVVLDKKNQVKLPFTESATLPDLAVLDPEMTITMPGKLTAATGMDALTHAIESYVSLDANPASDAMALHAIELISMNILQACKFPEDVEARGSMLLASFLAAVAFNHAGVGIVHAISHALGGVYHIPHGLANSIILPLGVEFNMETSAQRYAKVAQAMGAININPVSELQKELNRFKLGFLNPAADAFGFIDDWLTQKKAESLPAKLRELNQKLKHLTGFATDLKEAGIDDKLGKLDQVINTALEDGASLYNPNQVTADGVKKIVKTAYSQRLSGIEMGEADFKLARANKIKSRPKNVFSDEANLYEILFTFFEALRDHPEIGGKLAQSGLTVRFNYKDPDSSIAMGNKDGKVFLLKGKEANAIEPEVDMSMKADFAHYFWHGKANLLQALTRREVVAKGNIPKVLKLLPILEPAYKFYPEFLTDKGYARIVVD
jgi:alcohol dehydrogenase